MKPKPPSDSVRRTLEYYDEHAGDFVERTADIDMTPLYEAFLTLLLPGGRILDAGCGSGRDAAAFAAGGYDVVAFDGSREMARLAAERTGLAVKHLTFDGVAWTNEFDGVWACASLLHLPMAERLDALSRLVAALKAGGVLYVSLKSGDSEGERDGRWFSDSTLERLESEMGAVGRLRIIRVWETADHAARADTRWINALARKQGTNSTT